MIGCRTGQPEATLLPWRADQLTKAILVCKLMKPKKDEKAYCQRAVLSQN
jgi:hypothetical protein